jgi:hypothetical protein
MAALSERNRISSREYRKVVVASVFGTIIEWYDFFIYGTGAALVFNKLFFPLTTPWSERSPRLRPMGWDSSVARWAPSSLAILAIASGANRC